MFKRIIQITLLVLLAWFFKPILEVILPVPTEKMMNSLLDLSTERGRDWLTIWRFVVWVIFLAILIRFTKPMLSFVLPTAKRYGVTKPMRRFQGMFAEVFLFGLIFLILATIQVPFGAMSQKKKLLDAEWQTTFTELKETRQSFENKLGATEYQVEKLIEKVRGFVRLNKYTHTISEDKWPYNLNLKQTGIYNYLSGETPYEHDLNTSEEGYYKSLEALGEYPIRRSGLRTLRSLNAPSYSGTEEERTKKIADIKSKYSRHLYFLRNPYLKKPDLIRSEHYVGYVNEYNQLISLKLKYRDSLNLVPENPIDIGHLADERARESLAKKYSGPISYATLALSKSWLFLLVITIVLYVMTHFMDRAILGRYYTMFMRVIEQSRFGLGGSSRFAGLFEEWTVLFKNQTYGLFMGRSLYNPALTIGLEDPRHMVTVAGSRAGKGATAIIPNLLLWEGSALVIDPKGANAAVTARRREELGQKVHYVDPFNILGRNDTASFNPLSILDPNSPSIREQVNIIAEALVVQDPGQRDKHWDEGAKTIIAGLIGHLISSPKYIQPTLPMVRELISSTQDEQIELWADMSLNDGAGRLAMDAGNRIIRGAGTNEISGILSNADKHTEWLSSPAMVKMLSTTSFNFAELKDEPTTVYLILPPEYLETHKRFLRLFINLMISQMSVGGRAKVPVLMIMDEFLALGRMEEVEKAYGLMAGYNLILWPFIQDLGRLQDMYGKSVNAFIANSRAVQVFGVADEETKEFISKYLGDRTLSDAMRGKGGTYNNVVSLRSATEVAIDIAADTNRQYILRAGKAPLIIEKAHYYADLKFKGLYDPDPDYAD